MKSRARLDWLIILIFAGLVALFYWRILTPNLANRQSFPPGDFHAQFWAFATFEVRELSAGRLPLWNPFTFAGAPFWADVQSAVFYPPSLLTILLSAPWGFSLFALELEAIGHIWLAAVFTYLLLHQLTRSRAAAVIGALTFTFSGYLTGYPSQQLAVLEADVWLPLILLFLHRALGRRDRTPHTPWLLLAGVAWAMALLAGHPQSALIVAYISTAYFLFLFWTNHTQNHGQRHQQQRPRTFRQRAGATVTRHASRITHYALRATKYLSLFLLTGLALAAIQFIPAVEYTLYSVRAEGAYERMAGGLPLIDLIQVLLPGQVSLYSPLYVGVVGLILALTALFTAPNRHTFFWGSAAALTLLISFGGNTFLYGPLYLFSPGFSIFRGQERWAFATAFSLSVLAAYGFKQLSIINYQLSKRTPAPPHKTPRNTHYAARITHYLFLFALLLDLLFFFGLNNSGWTPDSPFYGLLGASTLLTLLLGLAWLLWQLGAGLPLPLFTALTAGLICFDLFSVNWQTNLYPQPPAWHTRMPAAVQAVKADAAQSPAEPYRVFNEFRLFDNYGVPYAVEDLWGASPLRPARYDEFLAPPMPIERTWALLNVKYVITWRQELFVPSAIIYQEPASDGTTYVHRLDNAGPRAWLVGQIQLADNAAILQTLADPNFEFQRIALLEENGEFTNGRIYEWANLQMDESIHNSQFTIHNSQFPAPGHIIHQISTPAPALLILSEPYYPGWQATVDGESAPIFRANYVLRAVPVPPGEHTIELRFQPRSFTLGASVSGLALVAVAASLLISSRRRRPA